MAQDIRTLGQQALRRLGVRIVPLDDSPTLTEMVPVADIANAAMIDLGIVNADGTQVAGSTVTAATIATSALVELGVLNSDDPSSPYPTVPMANIATAALIELGVIAADELPSSADQALVQENLASVHDSLMQHGIALWLSTAIPRAFTEEYVKLTAIMSASSFGKTADPANIALLEGRIRTGAIVLNNGAAFMLDMVNRVHDGLVARGIAAWPSSAIPHSYAEEYTKLTAAYASASFGRDSDAAAIAAFEDRIRTGVALQNVDEAYVLDKIASVHAALDAQGLVWWSGAAVPRAFAEEYTRLAVIYASAALAKPGTPLDLTLLTALEKRVRAGAMVLSSDDNAYQAVQAIHNDLAMRGIARWSAQDIPDAAGDQYVVLAANRLAPLFGMPANAGEMRTAEVALYRYVALPCSGEVTPAVYF